MLICGIRMYIKLVMFFICFAAHKTVASLSNPKNAFDSIVNSTGFPKVTDVSGFLSMAAKQAKDKTIKSYEPAKFIIGNSISGSIEICLFNEPRNCDSLTKEGGSAINAISVSGEHVYAGLESGAILRCLMREKHSCMEITRANSPIKSIAVAYEFIYAGLEGGIMRRCRIDKEDSCVEFRKEGASVNAIAVQNYDYVYAGFGSQIMECVQRRWKDTLSCKRYYDAEVTITALTTFGDEFIFVGLQSGALLRCPLNNYMDSCLHIERADTGIYSLYVFNGHLYAGLGSGAMLRCLVNETGNCEQTFTKKQGKYSFAITYSAVHLFRTVRGENERCSWQTKTLQCPPFVIYYNYKQRAGFELHVKNGEVYHCSGRLFDTSGVGGGDSALYVMEPGGRIYASTNFKHFLLHHSSMAGGYPVSAAGEIEVRAGVIKTIINFSGHYRPSSALNNQILDSLRNKGYTKEIEVIPCNAFKSNSSLYFKKIARPVPSGMPIFCNNKVLDAGAGIWAEA